MSDDLRSQHDFDSLDDFERAILIAYEKSQLESVATEAELMKLNAAARNCYQGSSVSFGLVF
ncbi:MAG: hypothetical protein FD157_1213 [Rhodocyclaceae bacterium]|nr:MAG: hypothetical protein FD157_1213 [Rhodocyclaceae bacterium]TND02794.1 MAG: hypothetical protein FD118_1820 [Rhodocyclaceae bacterium]